ncbi:hypothetical protein ABIC60_003486 [Phyllobacterium ifriqiyense]
MAQKNISDRELEYGLGVLGVSSFFKPIGRPTSDAWHISDIAQQFKVRKERFDPRSFL